MHKKAAVLAAGVVRVSILNSMCTAVSAVTAQTRAAIAPGRMAAQTCRSSWMSAYPSAPKTPAAVYGIMAAAAGRS